MVLFVSDVLAAAFPCLIEDADQLPSWARHGSFGEAFRRSSAVLGHREVQSARTLNITVWLSGDATLILGQPTRSLACHSELPKPSLPSVLAGRLLGWPDTPRRLEAWLNRSTRHQSDQPGSQELFFSASPDVPPVAGAIALLVMALTPEEKLAAQRHDSPCLPEAEIRTIRPKPAEKWGHGGCLGGVEPAVDVIFWE